MKSPKKNKRINRKSSIDTLIACSAAGRRRQARRTISIQFPGVGWVQESNDARQGVIGCTLSGHFFSVASEEYGNHYFYFGMTDPYFRNIGIDPGIYESSLVGYTGHLVTLESEARTASDVGRACLGVLESVYGPENIDEISSPYSVTITGRDLSVENTSLGNPWTARGGGGIWGAQREYQNGHIYGFSNSGNVDGSFLSFLPAPVAEGVETLLLTGIQWLPTANVGSDIRILIYQGGSDTQPSGSELIFDSGLIDSSEIVPSVWNTRCALSYTEIYSGTNLWIVYVTESGSITGLNFESLASGNIGEWAPQNLYLGGIGNDPSASPPTTFGLGATASPFGITPAIRLVYARSPFAGDGQWRRDRWPTPRVAAADWPTTSASFSNEINCGGGFPPDVGELYATRIGASMARSSTGLGARMCIRQGGSLRQPAGSFVLPGSEVRLNHTSTALETFFTDFESPVPINRSLRIWLGLEGDGVGDVHFELLGGSGFPNVSPRWGNLAEDNPYDWPANVTGESELEYENRENAFQDVDPNFPMENPYPSDIEIGPSYQGPGPEDTYDHWRPENITSQVVDFRTNSFLITLV